MKGHSHMAVVLKSNMETEANAAYTVGSPAILNIITHKPSNHVQIIGGNIFLIKVRVKYVFLPIKFKSFIFSFYKKIHSLLVLKFSSLHFLVPCKF